MRDGADEKRAPYLSVFAIVGAVVCQTLVLAGNLHTVHSLHRLGSSSSGWAATGLSLAESIGDFSTSLFRISKTMAVVIDDMLAIEEALDILIINVSGTLESPNSSRLYGNARHTGMVNGASPDTDSFIQVQLSVEAGDGPAARAAAGRAPGCLEAVAAAAPLLRDIRPKMRELVVKLTPALKQIQRWLSDLSETVQAYVGQFGVTMGRVQEIFDVTTESFSSALTSNEQMIEQTYNLFDTTNTGLISLWDLGNVSQMFDITYLQGDRAAALFDQYDDNGDHMLDKEEFGRMMLDPSTPGMMATVLRAYANRLAQVAGPLKQAETRAEVARSVASYLQVVVAKNMTKVGWMAQALTNGSLPVNFTVAVLNQLALAAENPDKLTVQEAGGVIVKRMVDFSPSTVRQALEFMVDPEAWASEGLDPELQSSVLERVTGWAVSAGISSGASACAALVGSAHAEATTPAGASSSKTLQQLEQEMHVLPALYRWRAERRSRSYGAVRRKASTRTADALLASETSRQFLHELLGTVLPASTQTSPQAVRAVRKGKPAAPEVLQFAQWLANNASRTSAMLSSMCFDYSARMSHTVTGLLSQIREVADKIYMSLHFVSRYASQAAMDDLVATFDAFLENADQELLSVCDWLAEEGTIEKRVDVPVDSSWAKVLRIIRDVEAVLPATIDSLEVAQIGTAGFSAALISVFEVMIAKVPLSFHWSARFWKNLWVTYYVIFLFVDAVMLFWILWISGYLGFNPIEEDGDKEDYRGPWTMRERLEVCWRGCSSCLKSRLIDRTMCFWSLLLLVEVFVLFAFVISLLLSVLAMIKIFIHSGCNELYMLQDSTVCTEVMTNIKFWLSSFLNRSFLTPLTVCDARMLLTCRLISGDLVKSSVLTVVGAFLGSFLTFQVIVESAILHERVRWRRAMKEPRTEL